MKKNEVGSEARPLSLVFLGFMIFGMTVGAMPGLFIISIQEKANHMWFFLVGLGSILGVPLISIPLFLICLKPFYTREAVSKFVLMGRREDLQTNFLIAMQYKSAFFWIDVFYPKGD